MSGIRDTGNPGSVVLTEQFLEGIREGSPISRQKGAMCLHLRRIEPDRRGVRLLASQGPDDLQQISGPTHT